MKSLLSGLLEGEIVVVQYEFRDASSTRFESSWTTGVDNISYRYGVWGKDKEDESSNFKELENPVDTLDEMKNDIDGRKGVEMFMSTDNSTA